MRDLIEACATLMIVSNIGINPSPQLFNVVVVVEGEWWGDRGFVVSRFSSRLSDPSHLGFGGRTGRLGAWASR